MNKEKETIIQIFDLLHVYKGKVETIALPGINLSVKRGERLVIRGKSGVGKSTLLYCVAGILKPTTGKILVKSKDITDFNEDQLADHRCLTVGLIYQSYNLAPFLNVRENIEFPMVLAKTQVEKRKKRIKELSEFLEIERYLEQKPEYLSGGEQQRVAIAVALANNPPIILADEPTGNIDEEASKMVYEHLSQLCQVYNKTLVLASHDPKAKDYADREIFLSKIKTDNL